MMKKRKILFVTHHMTVGGVQKSLISALDAINYEKNEVTLYLRKNRTDLLPFVNKNISVIVNQDKRHYYRMPKAIVYQVIILFYRLIRRDDWCQTEKNKLANYIRTKQMQSEHDRYFANSRYDIAISYVQGYTTEFVGRYISAGKKIAFYQGSVDEHHDVHKTVFPQFDYIAVEHKDVKTLLLCWYKGIVDEQKIVVVANYTDKNLLIRQGQEVPIVRPQDRIIICTCARMAPVKGFDLAVDAAKILRNKGYSFLWYFIGDGPERDRITERIEKCKLQQEVSMKGMQKNPYPYILNCDIYVQPSKEEALSIAMLEAQLLERPMVTTKTVGGQSMVEDGKNGLLTEITAESLADGIERLIKEPQLRLRIQNELKNTDYSLERQRYQKDWAWLLEV